MWGVNLCEKFSNVVGNVNYDVLLYLHLSFSLERLATIHHKKCFPFAKNVISKFSSHSPSLVFLNIIAHTLAFNIYIYIQVSATASFSCCVGERKSSHKNYFHFHNETSQHKPLMNRAKCDHYSKWKHEHTKWKSGEQCRHFQQFYIFCALVFLSSHPCERDHFNDDDDDDDDDEEDEHAQRYIYMYCIGSASIRSICLSWLMQSSSSPS